MNGEISTKSEGTQFPEKIHIDRRVLLLHRLHHPQTRRSYLARAYTLGRDFATT